MEYGALKSRTAGRDGSSVAVAGEAAAAFVELRAPSSAGSTESGQTILELSDGGKRRMTIASSIPPSSHASTSSTTLWPSSVIMPT